MRNEQCEMRNVKCAMRNEQCKMCNGKLQMENVQCEMCNVKCAMCNGKCAMRNVQCKMRNAKWEMRNEKWEMENEKCQMSNVKCAMWNVQCKIWNMKWEMCNGNMKWEIWESDMWNADWLKWETKYCLCKDRIDFFARKCFVVLTHFVPCNGNVTKWIFDIYSGCVSCVHSIKGWSKPHMSELIIDIFFWGWGQQLQILSTTTSNFEHSGLQLLSTTTSESEHNDQNNKSQVEHKHQQELSTTLQIAWAQRFAEHNEKACCAHTVLSAPKNTKNLTVLMWHFAVLRHDVFADKLKQLEWQRQMIRINLVRV